MPPCGGKEQIGKTIWRGLSEPAESGVKRFALPGRYLAHPRCKKAFVMPTSKPPAKSVEITGSIVRFGANGLYSVPLGTYHLNEADPARTLLLGEDGGTVATFTDREIRSLLAAKAMRPARTLAS